MWCITGNIQPGCHSNAGLPFYLLLLMSSLCCTQKPESDPCCTYTDLPAGTARHEGQGSVQVNGSTSAYFYLLDEKGHKIGQQLLNEPLAADAGRFQIQLNHFNYPIEVKPGMLTRCTTGTLLVTGHTSAYYHVMDSARKPLGYALLGKPMSFFPGSFKIKVNDTETSARVRLKALTEIRTGTLNVHGNTGEYYYVLDAANNQLNYNTLEKPLSFFPGTYYLKVNNSTMKQEVMAGKTTSPGTGNLVVRGLTEEYYYVTDTLGNALNFQRMNRSLAFFPGYYTIKVNHSTRRAEVAEGKTTELMTGSLVLTGEGASYYYVLDDRGDSLNYNLLNKSLSFFPSEYNIKLGASSWKVVVTEGNLTSINAD